MYPFGPYSSIYQNKHENRTIIVQDVIKTNNKNGNAFLIRLVLANTNILQISLFKQLPQNMIPQTIF